MNKNKELLFKMIITAVLTAMCFGLTYVSVPLPTGAKVHLGNFVCVLAGLLLGGIPGGIVGSVGMGLNDIVEGYPWNTVVRTFVVKFILGFLVGFIFRVLIKREKATRILLYSTTALFFTGFVLSLVGYFNSPILVGGTKKMTISILVPIFTGILALILLVVSVVSIILKNNKKKRIYVCVLTVASLSVVINLVLEFLLRWLLNGILYGSKTAFLESVSKIPSNVITGLVTISFVTIIYIPLYLALSTRGYSKYLIDCGDEDSSTSDDNLV